MPLLAVQLLDRSRHAAVIGTISTGGHSGLLSQLMHSAVSEIAQSPDAPATSGSVVADQPVSADAQPKHSIEFVDALLTLVGSLVASASGCTALADAGVIPALLPLIADSASSHIRLVCAAVSRGCTWCWLWQDSLSTPQSGRSRQSRACQHSGA